MEVVLVKHRDHVNNHYYDPKGKNYAPGDKVIIEMEKGRDYGTITKPNFEVEDSRFQKPLLKVFRPGNSFDWKKIEENRSTERKAFRFCREKISHFKLEMKLIGVEYWYDRRRLKFHFTSWNKVDFRELVKTLAKEFKTNVELRQIGVRDAAKILGGIGICGRQVCCNSHLREFAPVSLKMARIQQRSSHPDKISGICGRLRCCLKYEYETYRESGDLKEEDVEAAVTSA